LSAGSFTEDSVWILVALSEERGMNRLTKQISLVLISSSLVLHGCERPLSQTEKNRVEAERKLKEEQDLEEGVATYNDSSQATGSDSSTTQTSHGTGYRRGFFFIPWMGGRSAGSGSVGSGSMGVRSGSPGTRTGSSSVGSVRGGFGGSAHSASS
jgi:hypothetical protein